MMQSHPPAVSGIVLLAHFHEIAVNPEDILHRFDPDGVGLDKIQWLLTSVPLKSL